MKTWFFKTFYKKKSYKCLAYVNESDDKIVEAFQIEEYTEKRAFKTSYEILKLKYPLSGLNIRIKKNEKHKRKNR